MSGSEGEKVQYFELFFDLVYVFTLIQITRAIVADGSLTGVVHGLVVLALVWWIWVAFTSMANVGLPPTDTRDWRQPVFAAGMGLLVLLALSIPEAFWANDKLFAFSYLGLALLALGGQVATTRHDPPMRRAMRRLVSLAMVLPVMLVVTSFIASETISVALIAVGFICAILAPPLSGSREWKISVGHLAERYSLFMLITMGETIISLGEGATKAEKTPLLISAVIISFILVVILWRHYYTEVLDAGERQLHRLRGSALVRFARYGYTYLHFVMVAGLILMAAALKMAMVDVTSPLDDIFEACLSVGVGLFLLAAATFSKLAGGNLRRMTIASLIVIGALAVVGSRLPTVILVPLVVVVAAAGVDPRSLGRRSGYRVDMDEPAQ